MITREQLHYFIDSRPEYESTDDVVINLVCAYLIRNPRAISRFIEETSGCLSMMIHKFVESIYVFEERAKYLETYLDGKMYTKEYSNTEEAKQIQKSHATFIKEKCNNILEGKWYE